MSPTRRRAEANVIGGFLLIGWGGDAEEDPPFQLVSSAELREVLVEGDNDLRRQILWHLQNWLQNAKGKWRARLVPFLTDVWPYHRALHTPEVAAQLSDLAMASGDLFPQVVEAILRRLVPVRGGMLRNLVSKSSTDDHPANHYPTAMLDLLWAILARGYGALAVQGRGSARSPVRGAGDARRPAPVRTTPPSLGLTRLREIDSWRVQQQSRWMALGYCRA
jgi:hypothetical protein